MLGASFFMEQHLSLLNFSATEPKSAPVRNFTYTFAVVGEGRLAVCFFVGRKTVPAAAERLVKGNYVVDEVHPRGNLILLGR